MSSKPWQKCDLCPGEFTFGTPAQFGEHLRAEHSKREGGSHVCLFGPNAICPRLPYEGVSDRDYETHIAKCHIFAFAKAATEPTTTTTTTNNNNNNNNPAKEQQHSMVVEHSKKKKSSMFPSPAKSFSLGDGGQHDDWNLYSTSQSLTSILQDPSRPRSHYDNLFTKDWGFHFVEPPTIPAYAILKKSSSLLFDDYLGKVAKRNRRARLASRSVAQAQDCSSVARRVVPTMFFDAEFNLEDGETFRNLLQVFRDDDDDDDIDSLQTFFGQHSMSCVQKVLSDHLDAVEQDLAQQIGRRSGDFFQVMSSMDMVMDKLRVAIRQVSNIREHCRQLKSSLVGTIRVNIEQHWLRTQYRDLYRKVNWIATVHQTQPTIQLLLSKSDYAGALDLISTSQEVVTQELSGVISFRHLKLQLMEIETIIERMMNEEFVKYLTAEWNRPIDHSETNIHEERLLSIIYGMLKLQKFDFIDTFREEAFTAIKTNVKQTVIEVLSTVDSVEISRIDANLFEQLGCLDFAQWLRCLTNVFERLELLLARVKSVYNVISNGFLAVVANRSESSRGGGGSTTKANSDTAEELKVILQSDYYELNANLREILCSVCDFAHSRCASIIEFRVNGGDGFQRIRSSQFLELIHLIEQFVADCEAICGKKSPSLKLIVQLESNKFVTRFHEERREKIKAMLDAEQWKPVTAVDAAFQQLCRELVEQDSQQQQHLVDMFERYKQNKQQSSNNNNNHLLLGQDKFFVVKAAIELVLVALEYAQHAQQLSFLAADLLQRLLDLLKLFNSRTSQLVLGAGALHVAGLKTISARTLITSARSLTFVARLIPAFKAHFVAILSQQQPRSMAKQLDEVLELYENHCSKIPDKVIGLVRDVVAANLAKWVAKAPVPSAAFQSISQHLARLHDNIQDIMPADELAALFQRIHAIVIGTFRGQLAKLAINNDGGPQHGLVTQELIFYEQSLRNLSIGSRLSLGHEDLWSK